MGLPCAEGVPNQIESREFFYICNRMEEWFWGFLFGLKERKVHGGELDRTEVPKGDRSTAPGA
jgi:hypothetical protein